MCGFNDDAAAYFKYIFSLTFAAQAAASLGYIISCIGGIRSTADITPLILFPFLICGGLILSVSSIPHALQWMVDISLFQYAFIHITTQSLKASLIVFVGAIVMLMN
jgi:ABC-type multidrug transport system permease subunit